MRLPAHAHRRLTTLCALAMAVAALTLQAQTAPEPAVRVPLGHDAYDGWRAIQGTTVSRDGRWVVYVLAPQDGDGEVVARNLQTDAEYRHSRGKAPQITADSRFLTFAIQPLKADLDKAKKDKKKPEEQPKPGFGIMDLSTGQVVTAERVKSFKLAEDSGQRIAYLLEPAEKKPDPAEKKPDPPVSDAKPKTKEKKKEPGTDLVLRDLATGQQTTISEVSEYAWSSDGRWLAYAVSSKAQANDGAFVRDTTQASARALAAGLGVYKGLAFDRRSSQLAFVTNRDDYQAEAPSFALYLWTATHSPAKAGRYGDFAGRYGDSAGAEPASAVVTPRTAGVPQGFTVSEHAPLQFSDDGARLFFGTAPAPVAEPEGAAEPVKVDLWHWKDADLQPMQKVKAEDEKKRSYRAVVHVKDRRLLQLADREMPTITLSSDGAQVLGASDAPYRQLASWDTSYNDYYAVDLRAGARRKLAEKLPFAAMLSPGGAYLLFFDPQERAWIAQRTSDAHRSNLTGALGVRFDTETWDTPDYPQPYGTAGWVEGDKAVLLYDRYDIWEVRPDGTGARNLTKGSGRAAGLVFRYQKLDPDEKAIPSSRPLLLAATDDRTKASGFYSLPPAGRDAPAKLYMADKAVGGRTPGGVGPLKARDADVVVFAQSRFDEFPDLWVSDTRFTRVRKISDANPQQAGYVWGRAELMEYSSADGRPLRAVLTRPSDFDPAKKYPLLVHIYEERTDTLHWYMPPSPGTSINLSRYVSNGYVVLQPDIVYDVGYPGESAVKCVVPAVQKVLSMGFVDPARVGIQGHSWGGYQIAYLLTRTNIFRAAEAGAPVADMVSGYGGIRWESGRSRAFQYERTQSRIGAPPWQRPLQYLENSPIFWVEKIATPLLMVHNDEDGAVPWLQGIQLFTALRRLGKESYLFSYNGEKHGLQNRENQKHWTVHMAEYFDHYLKGAPRPEWMDKGVPFLERGKRDLTPVFRRTSDGKP